MPGFRFDPEIVRVFIEMMQEREVAQVVSSNGSETNATRDMYEFGQ